MASSKTSTRGGSFVIRCNVMWLALLVLLMISMMASLTVQASPVVLEESETTPSHTTKKNSRTSSSSIPSYDVSTKSLDCTCRQHQQQQESPLLHHQSSSSSSSSPLQNPTPRQNDTNGGARIFYLILAHNIHTLRDAIPLFRALRDPRHSIVFHVDPKVYTKLEVLLSNSTASGGDTTAEEEDKETDEAEATRQEALQLQQALRNLQDELESCPCGSRVHMDSVESVEWSQWSMNLPTIWGMHIATTHALFKNKWDTFINLSGDSMAVYTPQTMSRIVQQLSHYNFVTSRSCETGLLPTSVYDFPKNWHKRMHYTNRDKDLPPYMEYTDKQGQTHAQNVTIYFGSQWVVLQAEFVKHVVRELDRPDSLACQFRDYLLGKGKVMTDETFIPTLFMHTAPYNTTTLPRIYTTEDGASLAGSLIYDDDDDVEGNHQNNNPKLPKIQTLRYERMDEQYPSPLRNYYPTHPRYEVPHNQTTQRYQQHHELPNLPPEPHIWGPYYLGTYDLANIANSGALFVRKVSSLVDPNLHSILPVDAPHQIPLIQWPAAGIQTSTVPDWETEKLKLMRIAYRKAKAKGAKIPKHIRDEMEGDESIGDGGAKDTSKDAGSIAKAETSIAEEQLESNAANERHIQASQGKRRPHGGESHQRELGAAS